MAFEMSRTTDLSHDLPACHAGGRGFEPQRESNGLGLQPSRTVACRYFFYDQRE
jgi:hypothetical protein